MIRHLKIMNTVACFTAAVSSAAAVALAADAKKCILKDNSVIQGDVHWMAQSFAEAYEVAQLQYVSSV